MSAEPVEMVVGVVGRPIEHSLSPVLHRAAFQAMDLSWSSVSFDVGTGGGHAVVEAMRALGIRGLSVTMPLKAEVAKAVDRLREDAALLDSVNCLSLEGAEVIGSSTDGAGLVAALERSGVVLPGIEALVVGSGGAARSVIAALGRAGAARVLVVARDVERAGAAAALAGEIGRAGKERDAAGMGLVIDATPVGMIGTAQASAAPMVSASMIGAGQVAVDLVYEPLETPWLARARANGAQVLGGLGMLVHQAALQIETWTGQPAPVEAMWSAAERAVSAR